MNLYFVQSGNSIVGSVESNCEKLALKKAKEEHGKDAYISKAGTVERPRTGNMKSILKGEDKLCISIGTLNKVVAIQALQLNNTVNKTKNLSTLLKGTLDIVAYLKSQKLSDKEINEHPAIRFLAHKIKNLVIPNGDCSFFQMQNCIEAMTK